MTGSRRADRGASQSKAQSRLVFGDAAGSRPARRSVSCSRTSQVRRSRLTRQIKEPAREVIVRHRQQPSGASQERTWSGKAESGAAAAPLSMADISRNLLSIHFSRKRHSRRKNGNGRAVAWRVLGRPADTWTRCLLASTRRRTDDPKPDVRRRISVPQRPPLVPLGATTALQAIDPAA